MKKVYFILTYTGTILSKIVKLYTRKEYSHVSISLDNKLHQMYSFGRLNPYNAFIGGFVHESPNYGTFKRFKNTKSLILCLEITDSQYDNIKTQIEYFENHKSNYKFNLIGLFAVAFNIRWKKSNAYYCAEFVKYILERAKIENTLPEIIKPEDFRKIKNVKELYEGKLNKYTFV